MQDDDEYITKTYEIINSDLNGYFADDEYDEETMDIDDSIVDYSRDKLVGRSNRFETYLIEAMLELEKAGIEDFLLLKHNSLRGWWANTKAEIKRREKAQIEKERRDRVKEEALARLSDEEKEVLGLTKKGAKR